MKVGIGKGIERSLGLGRTENGVAIGETLLTGVEMHQRIENGSVTGLGWELGMR